MPEKSLGLSPSASASGEMGIFPEKSPAAALVTFTNSLAKDLQQTPPIEFKISVNGVAGFLLMLVLHASTR